MNRSIIISQVHYQRVLTFVQLMITCMLTSLRNTKTALKSIQLVDRSMVISLVHHRNSPVIQNIFIFAIHKKYNKINYVLIYFKLFYVFMFFTGLDLKWIGVQCNLCVHPHIKLERKKQKNFWIVISYKNMFDEINVSH